MKLEGTREREAMYALLSLLFEKKVITEEELLQKLKNQEKLR